MRRFILACLLGVLFLLPESLLAGGQFRGRVGHGQFGFQGSPNVIIINPTPRINHFHGIFIQPAPVNRFHGHVFIAPPARFIAPPTPFVTPRFIVRDPFFCFSDNTGFLSEDLFIDHLVQSHGIAFEAIPSVLVRSGWQNFYYGW